MPVEEKETTLEDVAGSVATLTTAVSEMQEGLVDRATVEQIAAEVAEKSATARGGYTPDPIAVDAQGNPIDIERELLGTSPRERFRAMLELPTRDVATVLGRDVEVVGQFRERADNLALLGAILGGQAGSSFDVRDTRYYKTQYLPAMQAAVDTQTAGEGAEFVPRELSSNLIERVTLALRVLQVFPEIAMPTNPFDLPARALKRTRGGRHTEQTADTGQTKAKKITPGSRKVTLEAAKFMTELLVSKEAEEDAIIAVLPFLQEELEDFTAADLEDAAINAATTARDSDSAEADDPRLNWNGLRKVANANSAERDHGGGDLTVAGLRANRKLMGKYGIDPGQLIHVIGMVAYIDLLSDTNVQTVDKYGANATVLTGELGRADGVPLIVSEYVRGDLNATGVFDNTTKTRTVALTAHRRSFLRGTRRQLTVEFLRELYSESDQDAVKVSTRQAFEKRYGTDKTVAASFNVDAT
jgi:hypothetical protein